MTMLERIKKFKQCCISGGAEKAPSRRHFEHSKIERTAPALTALTLRENEGGGDLPKLEKIHK